MTEEIIIDKEDKTKKHRNNEIDCLHFGCRKGENDNVLFWCDFYDDHCDNYTGCYYRKYLRLEQENKELREKNKNIKAHKVFLFKKNDKLMRNNSIIRIALNEIKDITTNALAKQRPYKEDFIEIQDIINKIVERQGKNIYRSALEVIRKMVTSPYPGEPRDVLNIINEVLNDK